MICPSIILRERKHDSMIEESRILRTKITAKRILVTSDIHGSYELFQALLEKMEYRPGEDSLVVIGDIIQKGPQNLQTLRAVMELARESSVYVLAGNNDIFACGAPDENLLGSISYFRERTLLGEMALSMGLPLPETVEEVAGLRNRAEREFASEMAFLRGLPYILETERFLLAHAGLENENLTAQNMEYVLSTPRFHETAEHVFQRLLLVGHWPAANYRTDRFSNNPIYHDEKNILSIDGGNGVKDFGQLNGVLLDNKTGDWRCVSVDRYRKITAPCSQKAAAGAVITWPENFVELLRRGEELSLCRVRKSGAVLEIPNDYLYEDEQGLRARDYTELRLPVEKGEQVSLIRAFADRLLIVKNGEAGLLLLR